MARKVTMCLVESNSSLPLGTGIATGCRCTPGVTKNFFLGIFVGMRQNGAEFGEVHPADEIKR